MTAACASRLKQIAYTRTPGAGVSPDCASAWAAYASAYLVGPGAVASASFFGLDGREDSFDFPLPFEAVGEALVLPQPLAHPSPRILLSRLLEGVGETTDIGGGTVK